jgi:hypothetical protein
LPEKCSGERRRFSPRRSFAWFLPLGAFLLIGLGGAGAAVAPVHVLANPIRPANQTALPFGERSHWIQPWRGYLETVPATRVLNGLGINFNPPSSQAAQIAAELAAAGFHRARIEESWCRVSATGTPRLTNLGQLKSRLLLLQRNHLRPLVLLNANEGCPGPLQTFRIKVTASAPAGARQLTIDPGSASRVFPGRTGLDSTTTYKAAAYLFTRVDGSTVTLSRPLARAVPAGVYEASTLEYVPFTRPGDRTFQTTMAGWLRYVGLVTHAVKSILGNEKFDVEVWNELSFGSDFLDVNKYYSPALVPDALTQNEQQILQRTVAYIRDPAHGVSQIGIGDGFANERPWESGANTPAGLTAIDKHPYPPRKVFPQQATFNGVRPVDALGRPEGTRDAEGNWHDAFIPHYTAFFPEYFLSGIQTETDIRDLSPLVTGIYGTPHGRKTHAPGAPPPSLWVTEAGMDPAGIPAPVVPRFQAKEALRWVSAWMGAGTSALYFYATSSPGWGMVQPSAPQGGPALRALGRLTTALSQGANRITRPRAIELTSVGDSGNLEQFAGDGTTAHPPLYDRDVVGFFPFQVSNDRIVIPAYVMTRNMLQVYRPKLASSDPARYDMPPAWYRLTITGTAGLRAGVSAVDPLDDRTTAVKIVARSRNRLVVDMALTDSPRLLILSGGA